MKITFISDTHTKHDQITQDLPGGELLIHAGDFMNTGYHLNEAVEFLEWFNGLDQYTHKVFIAGNHDRLFENKPEEVKDLLEQYKNINYLQDEELKLYYDGPNGDHPEDNVLIYGSPWQPEFYDWAFNLPRRGEKLVEIWNKIPKPSDIVVTHGPRYGVLDYAPYGGNVGCEELDFTLKQNPPKIHVCGHIHGGYGYKFDGQTHHINASVLNDRYKYENKPITVEWDCEKNELKFID